MALTTSREPRRLRHAHHLLQDERPHDHEPLRRDRVQHLLLVRRRRRDRPAHLRAPRRRRRARRDLVRAHAPARRSRSWRRPRRPRPPAPSPVARSASPAPPASAAVGPQVTFLPDNKRVAPKPGQSLLEIAEANGLPIEAGCRMGICGADPVAIKDGMSCTSAIGDDEKATLERLGYAENTRMACCVKVTGPVTVALTPDKASAPAHLQGPRLQLRQGRQARRRGRQRHRGRHRRRPPPPPTPGDQHRPDRGGAAPPLQPHGHQPPRLRPLRHAGPVPEPGHVVRRARDHDLAQHARAVDRPHQPRGRARHGGEAAVRPPDPRHRLAAASSRRSRASAPPAPAS